MSQWHGGKGSAPRPVSVGLEEFDNRWDAIFGKKSKEIPNETQEQTTSNTTDSDAGKSPQGDDLA